MIFSSVDLAKGAAEFAPASAKRLLHEVRNHVCGRRELIFSVLASTIWPFKTPADWKTWFWENGPIRNMARQLSPANLWMVTAGRRQVELHALLSSTRLRARLVQLKNDFDYVLIEAPPVGINGTATLLGPLADGVVLVIDANSTRREVARSAKASLERANVRLLGAVLNDRTFPIPDAIYRNI